MPSPSNILYVNDPAEIPTTPLSGLPEPSTTCTGLVLCVVVPSPSWPEELRPVAQTVPSPSNIPYVNLPRRSPPLRSAGCPIHPPPAPGLNYPWWYRPPVGQKNYEPVAQTVPSPFKYTVCELPAEIPTTPLSGLPDPSTTCTGLLLSVVVPSPS